MEAGIWFGSSPSSEQNVYVSGSGDFDTSLNLSHYDDSVALPANSTLRLYQAVSAGGKGDKGDPGEPAARRVQVVQAASAATDTAGVLSITLPADYATYHDLSIAGWETADDVMFGHDLPTAVLAAQTQTRNVTIMGNPAAQGAANASWNPATRVLTATQSRNAPWRIISAELHD